MSVSGPNGLRRLLVFDNHRLYRSIKERCREFGVREAWGLGSAVGSRLSWPLTDSDIQGSIRRFGPTEDNNVSLGTILLIILVIVLLGRSLVDLVAVPFTAPAITAAAGSAS